MMQFKQIPHPITILLSALMILIGGAILGWLLFHVPGPTAHETAVALAVGQAALDTPAQSRSEDTSAADRDAQSTNQAAPTAKATAVPLVVALAEGLPPALTVLTHTVALSSTQILTAPLSAASAALRLTYQGLKAEAVYTYTFAAAARFDTIDTKATWPEVQAVWRGKSDRFSAVAVLTDTLPVLTQILGKPGPMVVGYATQPEVVTAAWANEADQAPALVLLPFEQLEPRLVVLAIDGQNPVENANKFDPAAYPLVATIYAQNLAQNDGERQAVDALLQTLPSGNREADRLTVVAMTGVTAMVRLTAREMDKRGADWVAKVVGPELAAADITAISNEVPFVEGCQTNTRADNLTFCSKPEYLKALTDCGVDIIGLTGNHQNDYGREDAIQSLDFYDKVNLPVYGGGRNKDAAFAPLYREHNGNRLAFLGANSYGPNFAWATDALPGSAQFDLNIMSATIRAIKEQDRADVVLAELQYQESYDVVPLVDQRQNFNALARAGADIITGVQSHVPQAMEFTEDKLILYGLGNLFFDQMSNQTTREGMIVKHTIYKGRHLSTQVLTTLLYDYGQPQWTTPTERQSILQRVFGASYWEN